MTRQVFVEIRQLGEGSHGFGWNERSCFSQQGAGWLAAVVGTLKKPTTSRKMKNEENTKYEWFPIQRDNSNAI